MSQTQAQVLMLYAVGLSVLNPVMTVMIYRSHGHNSRGLTLAGCGVSAASIVYAGLLFGFLNKVDLAGAVLLCIAATLLGIGLLYIARPERYGRATGLLAVATAFSAGCWAIFV